MNKIIYRSLKELREETKNRHREFDALFQKLRKKKTKNLDDIVHRLHNEAFDEFDCLDCANCCKGISPIVIDKDMERLAKAERMKSADFIEKYLYRDEDYDYVFKQTPCPFLSADNYCFVYDNRPRACREYPHTDRARIFQILKLTQKNCEICPVVFEICKELCKLDW
ncbi:MAG: YkgJ family cysteine cluster protein [Mangrovibacterium sp.]